MIYVGLNLQSIYPYLAVSVTKFLPRTFVVAHLGWGLVYGRALAIFGRGGAPGRSILSIERVGDPNESS